MAFKGFEVALFISILAAAVLGKALSNDGQSLSYEFGITAALVIAVLAGYFWIIERNEKDAEESSEQLASKRREERRREQIRSTPHS